MVRMSHRTENRFRQREVSRAFRAAREAGAEVDRVEIDPVSGKIAVILAKSEATQENAATDQVWLDATKAIDKSTKAPTPRRRRRSAPTRR
jgi:hypothetical protein